MDRDALVKRFGELEASEGTHDYMTMKDGWKIHRETWSPSDPATAVVLFQHGDGESTRTVGARRMAHACTKRGWILEMFDANGHGDSLEKNGKPHDKRAFRGASIEPTKVKVDHFVELSEAVLEKHQLPLIIAGHSGGGAVACMATDRVIAACEKRKVPFAGALYLSPGLSAITSQIPCGLGCCRCCATACWAGPCCCGCCGAPVISIANPSYNPKGVLGEDNTLKFLSWPQLFMNLRPYPSGGAEIADAAANMTKLGKGQALVFHGTKDENIPVANTKKLGELVPALTVEMKDGFVHDYLNLNKDFDPTSCETIEHLMDVAAEKLKAVAGGDG